MSQYHEPVELLDEKARDISRALNSLKEEIEAVDWYNQRVMASKDEALKAIMAHNRDEEIEHAVMSIEWLRRNMDKWDEELRTYLFTEGDITELEEAAEGGQGDADNSGLKIGNLK
ncbi:MAG TPA: ferritin-like domain-containing protein [Tissierellaceae bacterium]|nr:ferritin-like domain-containing protein [Tissierellaceae bacterium]